MIRRFIIGTLLLLLAFGAMASGAGLWLAISRPDLSRFAAVESPVIAGTDQYREVAPLNVVVSFGEEGSKQFLTCQKDTCKTSAQGLGTPSDAVFDGQDWYYYEDDGSLHRRDSVGEDTLLVSQTDLVTPRDIVPHASGKVAYWLDNNIDKEDLTEVWVYDSNEGGTHVVAEKLVATDIVTPLRWNSAGTHLYFIADSGEGKEEKLELIVVSAGAPLVQARFTNVDIGLLQEAIERDVIDISGSGQAVAFVSSESKGDTIRIARDGAAVDVTPLVGSVPFLEWTGEGSFVYIIQRSGEMQFVRYADATHTIIGREKGDLVAAKISEDGKSIAYITDGTSLQLHTFELNTGLSRMQAPIQDLSAEVEIVVASPSDPTVAGVTSELTDGQIISFIEKQSEYILGENTRPIRVIVTDAPNAVLLDYEDVHDQTGRILLTIYDAVHPEWVVDTRYEAQGGQWRRVVGRGVEPTPKRLYEWEYGAEQWVLKANLDK